MNRSRPSTLCLLVLLIVGCAPGFLAGPDGGSGCSTPLDCDDGIACTLDTCRPDGSCDYTPASERCMAGETCQADRGCVSSRACDADGDCDDAIPCTVDSCGVEHACIHTPVSDRCDLAAGEVCMPEVGCRSPACRSDADCQDGNLCNGAEMCTALGCVSAQRLVCDDNDPCTTDTCDPGVATDDGVCAFRCEPIGNGADAVACGHRCPCSLGTWTLTRDDRLPSSHAGVLDFSTVTLEEDAAGPLARFASGATIRPYGGEGTCPAFWFVGNLEGACTNQVSLRGSLDGPDHFTGTLNVLTGGGCDEAVIPFTATRIGATS